MEFLVRGTMHGQSPGTGWPSGTGTDCPDGGRENRRVTEPTGSRLVLEYTSSFRPVVCRALFADTLYGTCDNRHSWVIPYTSNTNGGFWVGMSGLAEKQLMDRPPIW